MERLLPLRRRWLLMTVLSLLVCSVSARAQVPKSAKAAFTILYEETGKNGIGSWQKSCETKYSLSHWNEPLRGKGYTEQDRRLPLEFEVGAFSRLSEGAKVCFYPGEAKESGSGCSVTSATRVLSADGVYRLTETDRDGTHTMVTNDADFRREHNIPANAHFNQNARYYQQGDLAELTRTADGARLFARSDSELSGGGEWSVANEVEQQVWPEVAKFTLTNEELLNWREIRKVNARSAQNGDDQLSVRITLVMTLEKNEVEVDAEPRAGYGAKGIKGNQVQTGVPASIAWEVVDLVGETGSRSGAGEFHPYETLVEGAITPATPKVVITHPNPRLWRVTQITLYGVREIKRPIPEAFPVEHQNVFDDPSKGLSGHYEDVARNLESYGIVNISKMNWWVKGGTEAHEDSHRADHEAWFKTRWSEKGGFKEQLKKNLEELLDQSDLSLETLSEAAGAILKGEINRAFNDKVGKKEYKGDEDKAYAAGAEVFRARAAELRRAFAKGK